MNLEYKVMQKEDFKECASQLVLAFKEEPWNENWTFEQAYIRIEEIMSSKVSKGYVVYNDNVIVSMLCGRVMTYLDFKELWVDEFSVNPYYHRKGIGSKMLTFVRTQLKEENINRMALNTGRGYPSEKFYKKNGFSQNNSIVFMTNNF